MAAIASALTVPGTTVATGAGAGAGVVFTVVPPPPPPPPLDDPLEPDEPEVLSPGPVQAVLDGVTVRVTWLDAVTRSVEVAAVQT